MPTARHFAAEVWPGPQTLNAPGEGECHHVEMSEYKEAVWRTIGLFILFSVALSIVGRLSGSGVGDPDAVGVVLLGLGFVSLAVFIRVLFRLDQRFPRDSR